MDFLKKIFGNNTSNANSANQENFVVDETGNAKEASSVVPDTSAPISKPTPTVNPAPIANPVSTPNMTTQTSTAPIAPTVNPVINSAPMPQSTPAAPTPAVETAVQSDGEYVGDTSAFDELMKQAESSVDARVLDQQILDPEFQKAKDELENEGGIEIFPAE